MASIAEAIARVKERIGDAAAAAGRDPSEILLIAVSKLQPVESILEAYQAGIRDFGENYVQELSAKAEKLSHLPDIRLHLIGHLQRNKAKSVVAAAAVVHTVDSARLAADLGRQVEARGDGRRLPVLVEVNVGGEEQKSGCEPAGLGEILAAIDSQTALRLVGLMTVVPFCEDPADTVPYFQHLVRLRQEHGGASRLPELSMGMTHDLEPAIMAGATMVRVGTAIFGGRPPRGSV
jgi:PLP dependent protein